MNAPDAGYAAWIAKAANDILNIENNLMAERVPWDTVCFHAQQAAEKMLKGFLAFHNQPLSRTHDLVALLSVCVPIAPSLAALESDCQCLTYYAVGARYPDTLYDPGEEDGRAMIDAMRRIHAEILPLLRTP